MDLSQINVILDRSYKSLSSLPEELLQMENLKMLYLDGNHLELLPETFFQRLPKLYWLDLRGNKLKCIPVGIANHKYLENLLLQNNEIKKLPNELGLVPNLKVLQLSGNPLKYPAKDVIENGVDDICIFLKQEYYKQQEQQGVEIKQPSASLSPSLSTSTSTLVNNTPKNTSPKYALDLDTVPMILTRSLNETIQAQREVQTASMCPRNKKVHHITKTTSKLSLRSHYNSGKYLNMHIGKSHEQRMGEQQLKDLWLDRLRDLIQDQEKILQQEKTLGALTTWRLEKKQESPRSLSSTLDRISEAPYDTNPEYNKLMSRQDLTKSVEKLISVSKAVPENINIEAMINEVVGKLRGVEDKLKERISPTERLKHAEDKIKMIVDLHKKIAKLQVANNTY